IEYLFRDGHRRAGIGAQGGLRLEHLRRGTGAAPGFLEETAAASGLAVLRRAQGFATAKEGRLSQQHLIEEVYGVIEVVAEERVVALGEPGPDLARDFIHSFFRHDAPQNSRSRRKKAIQNIP